MNFKSVFYVLLLLVFATRFYIFYTAPKTFKNGDIVKVTARILSEPVRYETSQYLKVMSLKIYLPLYPRVEYGDTLIIEGTVDNGTLKDPKLLSLTRGGGLFFLRDKVIKIYDKSLPMPHSALVAGMVLGSKSGISAKFWDELRQTGTAHVVVASGMNVSLIASFLLAFFSVFWKRKGAIMVVIAGIWLYVLFSGMDAPVIRAGIMGTIAFWAQSTGRLSRAVAVLFVTAYLMLLVNPIFINDVGFLLSFFATLSLILFERTVREKIRFLPGIVRESLSTSITAQLGVAPVIYFTFGSINPLSPLVNLIIAWTVAPITVIGIAGGVLGLIYEPLGRVVLSLAYPMSLYFVKVIHFFA